MLNSIRAYLSIIAHNKQKSKLYLPSKLRRLRYRTGFTIVELLIVIIVIAILATITIIAYNGIIGRSQESVVKSDLQEALTQLKLAHVENGAYPADTDNIKKSDSVTFTAYTSDTNTFCLEAINNQLPDSPFHVTDVGRVESGECPLAPPQDGDFIQTITSANCPTDQIRAVDARDNHTYWVKKLADGKCWMLTNLAYTGGGTNTYSDTKTLLNGTSDGLMTYTDAKYYIPTSGSSVTTEPTNPSTSTNGTGQYGYLYNWCAAMGGQQTAACASAMTPAPNTSISICPAGWKLPIFNEQEDLNDAVNSGSDSSDAGLRTTWLAQYGGGWGFAFFNQGSAGNYWSLFQSGPTSAYLWVLNSSNSYLASSDKGYGYSVRCLAV